MKSLITTVSFIFILTCPSVASSKEEPSKYKSIYEMPRFIVFDGEGSKTDFMKRVLADLQGTLISAMRPIKFVDEENNITRDTLQKYKEQATKNVAKMQRRNIGRLNKDRNEYVTFSEYIEQGGYKEEDVLALYESMKKHGFGAIEKHAPIILRMEKTPSKKITTLTFSKDTLRTFIDLDLNSDKQLSMEEINTPSARALYMETSDTIAKFESYLSLSEDGNKTTIKQVQQAAEKAFYTLDINENGRLDRSEKSFYLRANLPTALCNAVPALVNKNERTYAVAIHGSHATTSLQFNSRFGGFTGYTEVEIQKQDKPINLILSSIEKNVWSIKGDVKSLGTVIIFGRGDELEVNAGAIGVPKEKIIFANGKECFDFQIPHKNFNKVKNKELFQKARGLIRYMTGQYSHLLRTKSYTSKIVIETQPNIAFFDDIDDALRKVPEGYNRRYWEEFLKWKTAGYKSLSLEDVHLGSYAYETKALPSWAGVAQLEYEGVLKALDVDFEKRKAVFLLQKDLPEFPGSQNSNPPEFTFIADKQTIKFPPAKGNRKASRLCIMSRQGDILLGKRYCSVSDLVLLKSENTNSEFEKNPIFVSLPPFSPALPSYKDSIEIEFEIDEELCERQYKDDYKTKCKFPQSITSKPVPAYALDIKPNISGKVSWKNNTTLTFTPNEIWNAGQLYTASINLRNLDMPKGIYVNNDRTAETKFFAAKAFAEASNVNIHNDLYDASLKLVTADLTSNYPLSDLRINVLHVPSDAAQPDEHIYIGDKGYENFGTSFENDLPFFEMPEMKKKLKLYVHNRPDNLEPTHLLIAEPMSATGSEIYPVRPRWVSLKPNDMTQLPEDIKKLHAKAQAGNAESQRELAKIYAEGTKVPKSLAKERQWLRAAAEQGDVESYVLLGKINLQKYLVEYEGINEAFAWYSKAAKLGNKEAQYMLGRIYQAQHNIYQDTSEMIKWFERSAKQDHTPAINELGNIYEYGRDGIEIGYKKALKYYRYSASIDSPGGTAALSRMYFRGHGVKKDNQKSYEYAKKAVSLAERDNMGVNRVASWHSANILLENFKSEKDLDIKVIQIADKVFKDFDKDYFRMWIANAIANEWGGDFRTLAIASEIIHRQAKETPKLEELRYVQAQINLKTNYYSYDQYEPSARDRAIKTMESLIDNDFFDVKVINRLTYLYMSKGQSDKAGNFLERLRIDKYYTLGDLAWSFAYYRKNKASNIILNPKDPDYQYSIARAEKRAKENAPEWKKEYLKEIEENPESAWTHGNFASFLLHTMDDYEGAIKYGEKALQLMDYPMARGVTGVAYLVKASQLFKSEKTAGQAEEYIKKAKSFGIDKWYIQQNCGEFCDDIIRMLKAYKKNQSKKPT